MLPKSLQNAINEFSKLPGIGPRSAQRIALYLLKKDQADIDGLSSSIKDVKNTVHFCENCFLMSDNSICVVCSNANRNKGLICVVEESLDAYAIERSGYDGLFHVLGGVLAPLEGIGPDNLNIASLTSRINQSPDTIKEIILATNPTLEGETTARHIYKLLKDEFPDLVVTRIARGLPTGGDVEYADDTTLSRALSGRSSF